MSTRAKDHELKYLRLVNVAAGEAAISRVVAEFRTFVRALQAQYQLRAEDVILYRGYSRIHCEYDAIYAPIDDVMLLDLLKRIPVYERSWRMVSHVRLVSQVV